MSKYRIENRSANHPTLYWHEGNPGAWVHLKEGATIFSENERMQFPYGRLFPGGGVWVRLDWKGANSRNEDAPAELRRNHFTTIKLRPIAIRLSTTEGEYEDLNAQALEFEAAVRLWVKGQQILTDGWMVDVIDED